MFRYEPNSIHFRQLFKGSKFVVIDFQDVLKSRGFPWPEAKKKGKKGGKKK